MVSNLGGPTYEEAPDVCQYYFCEAEPEGALEFYFGIRWFCPKHFEMEQEDWNMDDGPEVYEAIDE